MAIGNSKLHLMLAKGKVLSESVAWFNAFSPTTRREIIEFVQQDQLMKKGVDGQDRIIGFYSYLTSLINPKKRFNTPYTLYDTGEFYRSMYVRVLLDAITIEGETRKMEDKKWWTDKILTLTDENTIKLQKIIKDSYIKQLREILFNY